MKETIKNPTKAQRPKVFFFEFFVLMRNVFVIIGD